MGEALETRAYRDDMTIFGRALHNYAESLGVVGDAASSGTRILKPYSDEAPLQECTFQLLRDMKADLYVLDRDAKPTKYGDVKERPRLLINNYF